MHTYTDIHTHTYPHTQVTIHLNIYLRLSSSTSVDVVLVNLVLLSMCVYVCVYICVYICVYVQVLFFSPWAERMVVVQAILLYGAIVFCSLSLLWGGCEFLSGI